MVRARRIVVVAASASATAMPLLLFLWFFFLPCFACILFSVRSHHFEFFEFSEIGFFVRRRCPTGFRKEYVCHVVVAAVSTAPLLLFPCFALVLFCFILCHCGFLIVRNSFLVCRRRPGFNNGNHVALLLLLAPHRYCSFFVICFF
jgi:hypothetical protein